MSNFQVGDRVRIHTLPPYLKSADPMPMLRPPDLVTLGEEGTVLSRKPGGYMGIRFGQGTFLIDAQYVERTGEETAEKAEDTAEAEASDSPATEPDTDG